MSNLALFLSYHGILINYDFLTQDISICNSIVWGESLDSEIWPQNLETLLYCVVHKNLQYAGPFKHESPV